MPLAEGDNTALVQDFCLYPDSYYDAKRRAEIAPYIPKTDGITFHYPPHTPYEEAYRYWDIDGQGRLFRPRPFVNANFTHVMAGLRLLFTRAVECLRAGEAQEGRKHLGTLLHTMQDSVFGLHALEGPGGADAFVLDRMTDPADFPLRPSTLAADISADECRPFPYRPHSLGRTPDEASMRLYAEYAARVAKSRKWVFSYILKANQGDREECRRLNQKLFENAVEISADVIHTTFAIARGRDATPPSRPLTDMEPHHFPFGGFRPYRYAAFERDCAIDENDRRIPIRLTLPDGHSEEFPRGISFGSHAEGELLFWIAPGSFDDCRMLVGFHSDLHFGTAALQIINDGKVVEETMLDGTAYVATISPCRLFGLRFRSSPTAGCLCLVIA
jgi:hypothetical protein